MRFQKHHLEPQVQARSVAANARIRAHLRAATPGTVARNRDVDSVHLLAGFALRVLRSLLLSVES
jgi:hypothetical protein